MPGLPDQREHAGNLHRRGADDLFRIERNQPTLYAALARLPGGRRGADRPVARARPAETRSIAVLAAASVPGLDALFPHAAQVIRVIRTRTDTRTGRRSREMVCAITSLDHRQADPGLLAGWPAGLKIIGA